MSIFNSGISGITSSGDGSDLTLYSGIETWYKVIRSSSSSAESWEKYFYGKGFVKWYIKPENKNTITFIVDDATDFTFVFDGTPTTNAIDTTNLPFYSNTYPYFDLVLPEIYFNSSLYISCAIPKVAGASIGPNTFICTVCYLGEPEFPFED